MGLVRILIFSMIVLSSFSWSVSTDVPIGICECAVFDVKADALKSEPILQKNTEIDMPVNEEGRMECAGLCAATGKAGKKQAPVILCNATGDAQNLLVTVYSRLTPEPWTSTNQTSKKPICCVTKLPVPC